MILLARWLHASSHLAAALALALLLMQLPAVTREYQSALAQLARAADADIAARKESARRYYGIDTVDDAAFLDRLRALEPSNAETLQAAIARGRSLQASYDRIERAPALARPIVAAEDAGADDGGTRRPILATVLDNYAPQLDLSLAAALYGLAGLFLGSLLGELLGTALFGRHRAAPAL